MSVPGLSLALNNKTEFNRVKQLAQPIGKDRPGLLLSMQI